MDVAVAIGGGFLSAFLQVAFDRISSSRKFLDFFQLNQVIKFDEETLDRLEISLDTISVVLEDAEQKQLKSPSVKRWLNKLKAAMHHADDLLDELNTECLRLQHDDHTKFDRHSIQELMPNIEKIVDRLEYFVKQIHVLGLHELDPKAKSRYRAPSSSVVDKSLVFGREDEREKLIQMVLSEQGGGGGSDVSVIPITGLGGVGKTTLAQLIYNDEMVKNKFSTLAWVCVSEDYDAFRLTKALLMEVNSLVVDDKDDYNRLQVKLRDNVAGKRFLIILDDVWNDNYNDWRSLMNPLNHGSGGSKIIVTTRSEKVASMVQTEPFHHIQPISRDQSWSLFKSDAFDHEDHSSLQQFETIGREIVEKCKGLPLAIKTVAGALRPKRDINEWHDILTSEIWSTGSDVLPALSLSYKHLPSHLKCCFAFCSVFPKDIPFDKEEVILLWMANDLVQPSSHKSLKEIGREYFEDLRVRSLFEIVNGNYYIMHDLVNDLSRYVSGNFCVRLQDYEDTHLHRRLHREIELPREALHFSYSANVDDTSRKFRALAQIHSLRTFLPVHPRNQFGMHWKHYLTTLFFSDILPRFQRIRALTLSEYKILVVPDSIGDLKHLRFLNLARTAIIKLPKAIGKCLNLQTLILANCRNLKELPKEMQFLINLQHLDVRGVGDPLISKMDIWLKILKDIQNLSIVVDKIHGSVLEKLNELQPCKSLVITGLENVSVVKRVELENKNCIEKLTLEWGGIAECSVDELHIFSKLQPHTNTNHLTIKGYRGTTFSAWLGDSSFNNMESLSLQNCKNCFILPPLGQLVALKKLYISGMSRITEVGEEFYGNQSTCKPFQALEELRFSNLVEWEKWNKHPDVEFSSLQEFCITDCPKLVGDIPLNVTSLRKFEIKGMTNLQYNLHCSLPSIPSLQVAKISDFPSLREIPNEISYLDELVVRSCPNIVSVRNHVDKLVIRHCPSVALSLKSSIIKELVIGQCKHLEFPTGDSCNSSLESLRIENCGDSIEGIPLGSFSKLRKVYIYNWESPELFKFPNGYSETCMTLQSLDIYYCNNLLSFPEGGLHAPNLKELWIWGCKKLKSLPEQMHTQLLSLHYLRIEGCPEIECFPERGLPASLETFSVSNCKKLMSFQTNWGLQKLPAITKLYIDGAQDKLYPDKGLLPSSIQELRILGWPNLETLNHKGLQHLSSLQSLTIIHCPNLRCLPEVKLSSSLSELTIINCGKIESFPEDGLTSSLSELYISKCPKLKASMEKEKGEDWPKVAHIPLIKIDYKLIS